MFYLQSIPLIGIVIATYLIMSASAGLFLDGDVYAMTLALGRGMILKGNDIFLLAGVLAMFLDMLKGRDAEIPARILSAVTFLVALGCLLLYAPVATPAFLLLTAMSLAPALLAALKL